ncbi:MAG: ABC transporter ATP-binding protein [Actinomycetes bacterium]
MNLLSVEQITAGYGKNPVVSEVSVRADEGEIVAVVGPNGAGKSTALKAIFALVARMAGRVVLEGRDLTDLPTHRLVGAGLGYVPQVDNVFPSMSVAENLEMGAYLTPSRATERARQVLGIFPDLASAEHRRAGTLSGGQRNMLGMARALMLEPRVLLLDEPTAGLSPAYVQVVWDQVVRIADTGTAVVVVEQNVARALRHAHRVYVLIAGRNRVDGPAAEIAGLDLAALFLGGAEHRAHDSSAPVEHGGVR